MRESTSTGVAARPPLIWLHVLFCTYFGHPFLVNHNKLIRYFFHCKLFGKERRERRETCTRQHCSVLLIDVPTQIRDVKALWVIPSSFSYPKSLVKSL